MIQVCYELVGTAAHEVNRPKQPMCRLILSFPLTSTYHLSKTSNEVRHYEVKARGNFNTSEKESKRNGELVNQRESNLHLCYLSTQKTKRCQQYRCREIMTEYFWWFSMKIKGKRQGHLKTPTSSDSANSTFVDTTSSTQ